jgi:C4-dicarboxylate transporter DctM subunit
VNTLIYLSIVILALLGLPLFMTMALITLVSFYFVEIDSSAVSISMYQIASQPMLVTFPLFTFSGFLIAQSQSPQRLFRLTHALFGRLPSGMAFVSLFVCAFFTAFTGASGITIIALGGILYPILKAENYKESFNLGLITTCGSLGLLFPPSLPIILYGLVGKVDIDSLFKAGILPGLLLILLLGLYAMTQSTPRNKQAVDQPHADFKEVYQAIRGSIWEILLPIGVLVGIYGGFMTTSETAALTAGYCVLMECFIYKEVHVFKDIPGIICKSLTLKGAMLLILCCALALTDYLVDEQIPMKILTLIQHYIHNKYIFLIFLNIFLLIVGCMMDIFSAIVVVVPIIVPIALEYQIHPVHLAIIFLTNLEIGFLTPPFGLNLFLTSFRFKRPMLEIYKSILPFFALLIFALLIITYVPALSLSFIK